MKPEKFYTSYSKLSEIKLITIGLASTELIKYWAEKTLPNGKILGEVINANTLHHKTFKPLKGGLFCERIFGPLKDFECACGKPLKYKKERTGSHFLDPTKEGEKEPEQLAEKDDQRRSPSPSPVLLGKKKGTVFKGKEKRNQIYNKTSSIFGLISSKARNYCPMCDVEYTWSVIRRYQLGYINLITPVSHIWYLKGTPSYLSILLDFKKRDLVSIAYCASTLTIENLLKGSIPNFKSADIVSSWKNLKKQIIQNKNKNNKISAFSPPPIKQIKNEEIKKKRGIQEKEKEKAKLSLDLNLEKNPKSNNFKMTTSLTFPFPSKTGEGDRGNILFDRGFENKEVTQHKINCRKTIKLNKKLLGNLVLPFKKNYLYFNNLFGFFPPVSFPVPSSPSPVLLGKKQGTVFKGTVFKEEEEDKRGEEDVFFPKEILKKIKINNYILLYLNIFSENKIWLRSFDIIWSFLIKKAYKASFLRIQEISTKFDYLQFKPNINLDIINRKKDKEIYTQYRKQETKNNNIIKTANLIKKDYKKDNKKILINNETKLLEDSTFSENFKEKLQKLKKRVLNLTKNKTKSLMKFYLSSIVYSSPLPFHPFFTSPYTSPSPSPSPVLLGKKLGKKKGTGTGTKMGSKKRERDKHLTENSMTYNENQLDEKKNYHINQFNSFQYIHFYGLSTNSAFQIYYLLAKMLSRSILKEAGLIGRQKIKIFIPVPPLKKDGEEEIKKKGGEDEGIRNSKKDLLPFQNFKEKKTRSEYLEIFNKLITLFIKNSLINGSFKSTFFERYFDYSIRPLPKSISRIADNNSIPDSILLNTIISSKQNKKLFISQNLEEILVKIKTFLAISTDFGLLNIFALFLKNKESFDNSIIKKFNLFLSSTFFIPPFLLPISLPFLLPLPPFEKRGGKEGERKDKRNGDYPVFKRDNNFYNINKKLFGNPKGKINNKIEIQKKFKKGELYNNFYALSYRELWSNDNDWNIIYYYLSSLTDNSNKIIPNYKTRYPNWVIGNSSSIVLSPLEKLGEPPFLFPSFFPKEEEKGKGSGARLNKTNKLNTLNLNELKSEYVLQKTNFFSGSALIQKLLAEYTVDEIKQIDKQNRILLYQLNKQIIKLKNQNKKKLDKSLTKELRQYYKKRDLLIRRTKLVRKIFRKESPPQSLILNVLPVLPPDLRPIVKMGNQIAASDLNRLYQRVIYRNERLKNFLKDSATSNSFEMKYAQRLLQEAVDNLIQNGKSGNGSEKDSRGRLLKSLSDILKGKQGRFRQYLLGKRVDYSGRSVIVVGPKLKLHECGLPKEIALELYLPFLLKRMLNQNLARTIVGAKMLIKTNSNLIYQLLKEIMQTSPILLNRAPTLHRLGIQAFQPILIEGRAILLHPLVCSAFNADFDGDQMAVHVPITVEARAEAWKLMLSRNNILAPSTGDPLAIPSQDMVLGCYYLTTNLLNSKISYSSKKLGSGLFFTKTNHVEKAYELKKIDLHANIWLKWYGKIENGLDQEEPIEIRIDSSGKWKEILNKYQKNYSFNNVLQNSFILTTVGRVLFNIKIQNCLQ